MDFIQISKNIAKNKTALLILIVLLGIALRITRALEMNRYDVDCYTYFNMAINWAKYGAEYAYQYGVNYCPPLLPWLMSVGYKFGFRPETTGTFLGILLGSMIPLCMFYIANILFRRPDLALLAAFLGAIHPSLVRISARCLRDSLYIPFVAIALICAVSAIKNKSLFKWCLFSVVAALACLTRYEGQELIIFFLIWLFVEIVVNLISKFRLRTTNHETKSQPPTINYQLPTTKYYCYSLFSVLVIFSILNLCISYSLKQTKYTNQFFSLIKTSINLNFTE